MLVRSALLISASPPQDEKIAGLVAKPEEVEALKNVLVDEKIGFFGRVQSMIEDDVGKIKAEIDHFFGAREHHELLLFYLSGFELINEKGEIYFINSHTDPNRLEETALSATYLRQKFKECKARQKVFVLDCYSRNPLDEKDRREKELRLKKFTRATGAVVLTSQDTMETAYRDDGSQNPGFTETLVQGLKTGDADFDGRGYITENELFLYIYQQMNAKGTAPNLFLSTPEAGPRIKIAKNIKFSTLPEMAKEQSSLDFRRFMRLWKGRKEVTNAKELASLREVLSYQPEMIFLRRLGWGVLITLVVGSAGSLLLSLPLDKGLLLALLVFISLMIYAASNFKYRV